ncbi:hypothetical protein K1719_027592 [Acacia pycnantha]|nr:hypothetical protein K1719_027592 [Acacia pycnantha]
MRKSSSFKLAVTLLLVVTILTATVGAVLLDKRYIEWEDFVVTDDDSSKGRVITIDQTGTGDSTTIQGALDRIPNSYEARIKIVINPGTYKEIISVPESKSHISFIGRPGKNGCFPLIQGSRKASDKNNNGTEIASVDTQILLVQSEYFVATGISIENNAVLGGYNDQAVAVRVDSDKAMFYRVKFLGNQDTLLDSTRTHFFYQCYIEGTVDFIWGNATSLYEGCTIHSKRGGSIAAQARTGEDQAGFVLLGCKIEGNGPTLLGRAYGPYSRTIFSFCTMDYVINPLGWSNMDGGSSQESNPFFGEYMNEGLGSNRSGRVSCSEALTDDEALRFVGRTFINGSDWLRI